MNCLLVPISIVLYVTEHSRCYTFLLTVDIKNEKTGSYFTGVTLHALVMKQQ